MADELFVNPLDAGRKLVDLPDESRQFDKTTARGKTGPAELKKAAVESEPESTPKAVERERKTGWQASSEIQGLIESLAGYDKELSIVLDQESQTMIIKVVNTATGEVIRRVPLRDPIHSREGLAEIKGLLLDVIE